MVIYLVTAAMLTAVFLASALALSEEAQRKRAEIRVDRTRPFGTDH